MQITLPPAQSHLLQLSIKESPSWYTSPSYLQLVGAGQSFRVQLTSPLKHLHLLQSTLHGSSCSYLSPLYEQPLKQAEEVQYTFPPTQWQVLQSSLKSSPCSLERQWLMELLHVNKINIWNIRNSHFLYRLIKSKMDNCMYVCLIVQRTPPRRSTLAISFISQCVGMVPTWVHWPKKNFFGMTERSIKGSKY